MFLKNVLCDSIMCPEVRTTAFFGPRKGLNIRIFSNIFQAIEYGAQFELLLQGSTHGILTLSPRLLIH